MTKPKEEIKDLTLQANPEDQVAVLVEMLSDEDKALFKRSVNKSNSVNYSAIKIEKDGDSAHYKEFCVQEKSSKDGKSIVVGTTYLGQELILTVLDVRISCMYYDNTTQRMVITSNSFKDWSDNVVIYKNGEDKKPEGIVFEGKYDQFKAWKLEKYGKIGKDKQGKEYKGSLIGTKKTLYCITDTGFPCMIDLKVGSDNEKAWADFAYAIFRNKPTFYQTVKMSKSKDGVTSAGEPIWKFHFTSGTVNNLMEIFPIYKKAVESIEKKNKSDYEKYSSLEIASDDINATVEKDNSINIEDVPFN